ncbi:MAG: Tim44 domain-containing protein [Rhodospirillales bacterium]|nr:Tim44 domain-containing protein [Rhodospirillales bacterium]
MSEGFAFFDIIFFAMVAAFLILRLRGVLGRRTGNEDPDRWTSRPPAERAGRNEAPADNVTRLPDRTAKNGKSEQPAAAPATPLEAALTQIKLADSSFDPDSFLPGARSAFEMIVTAFAQGDTSVLRPLLADDVYEDFAGAIHSRQQAKQTLEKTLVSIRSVDIVEARMDGRMALVTIKFVSEQVSATRNANGEVVDGDPAHVATITDVWTFARNTRSRDPNWLLVATSANH